MLNFLTNHAPSILNGLLVTIFLSFASLFFGMILAFLFAILESIKFKPIAWFFSLFVMIIRGLPELIVVLSISFLISMIINLLGDGITLPNYLGGYFFQLGETVIDISFPDFLGGKNLLLITQTDLYDIPPIYFAILALSLLYGAYASQTLRGAFKAVPSGQKEAAYTLGISKRKTLFCITIPQIWQHALPGLSNQWLVLLKDTALVGIISVTDLLKVFRDIVSNPTYTQYALFLYLFAACIYLLISILSQMAIKKIERYAYRYSLKSNEL